MQESVIKITSVVDRMIARCDAIADCAQNHGKKACNIFTPNESRKTAQLCLDFVAAIAGASSMAAVVASHPALEALAEHAQAANDAIASALPKNCRSLITCVASGEQFFLNLLLRGDSGRTARPREDRPSHGAPPPPDFPPLLPEASRTTHGGLLNNKQRKKKER